MKYQLSLSTSETHNLLSLIEDEIRRADNPNVVEICFEDTLKKLKGILAEDKFLGELCTGDEDY